MTTHEIKCWPKFYQQVIDGRKTFELRRDDREYNAGDHLLLREWFPDEQDYSTRECLCYVPYLLRSEHTPGHVIMSIRIVDDDYLQLKAT